MTDNQSNNAEWAKDDWAEWIEMLNGSAKRAPKNKAPGDAKEMQAAIIKALKRAYHGGSRDWETYDEETCQVDDSMPAFGDLMLEMSGSWHHSYSEAMVSLGNAVAAGIQKVIDSNDPDAAEKIRRLSQVAIGAGYIFALLDDKEAGKRRSPVMSDGRTKASSELADKIRRLADENPNMTQTAMGEALGVNRKTIGKYLNQESGFSGHGNEQ